MSWQHLAAPPSRWRAWPSMVANAGDDVVLVLDRPAALVLVAASAARWVAPLTLWLGVSGDYSAPLAARDVKTLSWLVPLRAVVIGSDDGHARDHAVVVAALLEGDDVSVATPVVTVSHAYNRPLPPTPVSVWWTNDRPTDEDVSLQAVGAARHDAPGAVTSHRRPID